MHEVALLADCENPYVHRAQVIVPAVGPYWPGGHTVHCVLPVDAAFDPAGQSVQSDAPCAAANRPAPHGVHAVEFDVPV